MSNKKSCSGLFDDAVDINSTNSIPKDFEAFEQATRRRKDLITKLEKSSDFAKTDLAARLSECTKGRRCGSGACSVCLRRYRLRLIEEGHAIMQGPGNIYLSTIIPADCGVYPARHDRRQLDEEEDIVGLNNFGLAGLVEREQMAIQKMLKCKPWVIIGGVDISYTTNTKGSEYWQVLLHFVTKTPPNVTWEDVRSLYNYRSPGVWGRKVDDLPAALSFAFRSWFGTFAPQRSNNPYNATRPRRGRLSTEHLVELAAALDLWSIDARLVLVGAQQKRKPLRLRLIDPR